MPASRKSTVLHVFVSSPSDCKEERQLVRDVIHRLNVEEALQARRIELRPVMWEDFPPGEGRPGDTQKRVDDLLRKYELSRYAIYVGILKRRGGTPTPDAPSGTISEFRSACRTRRRSGFPTEVLVYFLSPEGDDVVSEFREGLENAGFLYHEVNEGSFEHRITTHLRTIASEWNTWKKGLARWGRMFRRPLMLVLLAFAGLSILAAFLGDALLYQRFSRLRDTGATAAMLQWERLTPYMVFSKDRAGLELSTDLFEQINADQDLSASLDLLGRWSRHSIRQHRANDAQFQAARNCLQSRLLEFASLPIDPPQFAIVYGLFQQAYEIALWEAPSESLSALRSLAGHRMLADLTRRRTETADYDLNSLSLHRKERDLLVSSAARALGRTPAVRTRSSAAYDALIAQLATDWSRLEQLTTLEAANLSSPPAYAAITFAAYAPSERVAAWMDRYLTADLPPWFTGIFYDAARHRRDSSMALAVADAVVERKCGDLPFILAAGPVLGIDASDKSARARFTSRVAEWLRAGISVPISVFNGVAPLVELALFSEEERQLLGTMLLHAIDVGEHAVSADTVVLMAQLGTPETRAYLDRMLQDHLEEHVIGAAMEKEGLVRSLDLLTAAGDVQCAALKLARFAHDDALRGRPGTDIWWDIGVQIAYLDSVAKGISAATWPQHEQFILELIDRRMVDFHLSPYRASFDRALQQVIGGLPSEQSESLFREVCVQHPGAEFNRRVTFVMRLYARSREVFGEGLCLRLRLLHASKYTSATPLEDSPSGVALNIYSSKCSSARDYIEELVASGADELQLLDEIVAYGNRQWSTESVLAALDAADTSKLDLVVQSLSGLREEDVCPVLDTLVKSYADRGLDHGLLLQLARQGACRREPLIQRAKAAVLHGPPELRIDAIQYLRDVDTPGYTSLLVETEIQSVIRHYGQCSSLIDWVFLLQEIDVPLSLNHVQPYGEMVLTRPFLIAHDADGDPTRTIDGYWMAYNPLALRVCENLAFKAPEFLHRVAVESFENTEFLGQVSNAPLRMKAYLLWLCSARIDAGDAIAADDQLVDALFSGLGSSDSRMARACAAAIAALTSPSK